MTTLTERDRASQLVADLSAPPPVEPPAVARVPALDPPEVRIERVLARTFRGIHHVPYWRLRKPAGTGIVVTIMGDFASFDSDTLTRLVVAAHDDAVRVEIRSLPGRTLQLLLHPRERLGDLYHRHPTMEDAVASARGDRW
jgi:hypothetical protein